MRARLLQIKLKRNVTGLTLVEVMVGMLMSTLFLSTTLQTYMAAASLRVKSQQTYAALSSIQSDAEVLRRMAQEQPRSAAECRLPPASSYAQRLIERVMDQDAAMLSNSPRHSADWGVGAMTQQQQSIQQVTTLPIATLPDDYQIRRTFSIDLSGLATTADTLQVAYTVERLQNENDQSERSLSSNNDSTTAPIAQFRTAVMPHAALVCPS